MKLVKRIMIFIIIFIVLILFSTPCFATEETKTADDNKQISRSLTKEQQAYLQRYVLTYVEEGGKKDLFRYDTAHDIYQTYDNIGAGDRKNTL